MEQCAKRVLLSTAYLAPVQYYSKLAAYGEVWIEGNEHFLKQSYRNRCVILTANGVQNLSIPVAEGSNSKRLIRDVAISYDHPWQKLHWRAILSAYGNAPFFEYYSDSLAPFFHEKKWKFLVDFNRDIQAAVSNELGLKCNLLLTGEFVAPGDGGPECDDFRYAIHPKSRHQAMDNSFTPVVYMQVFQEKFGFTPNLGIIDLLFNEGPEAMGVLQDSFTSVEKEAGNCH